MAFGRRGELLAETRFEMEIRQQLQGEVVVEVERERRLALINYRSHFIHESPINS